MVIGRPENQQQLDATEHEFDINGGMFRQPKNFRQTRSRRAFTLIETALATLIVGLGVASSMQLFAACSIENRASGTMSVAMLMANNVREAMGGLSFRDPGTAGAVFGPETGESLATWEDVDDFDGSTFSPPIDSLRQQIPDQSQYSQVVSVWPVNPNQLSVNSNESSPTIAKTTYTGAVRVRVRILYQATPDAIAGEVYRTSWIRVDN